MIPWGRLQGYYGREAMVWRDRSYSYEGLLERRKALRRQLDRAGVGRGTVVSVEGDFSPNAVALLLALLELECVIVPMAAGTGEDLGERRRVAQVEVALTLDREDEATVTRTGEKAEHPLVLRLRRDGTAGLVLFSSASTGVSKAIVHDLFKLLDRYRTPRPARRTLAFLLFDHIGGINTLFHTLINGGCLIVPAKRNPDEVCRAIARHRAQVLPASPTFLNLLMVSGAASRHDLGSLELVTYGTEVMPESTLLRLNRLLPYARLLQTYGLSEVGILKTKSRSSDSLWVKVGGEGFETRVVNGMLEIKSESATVGLLNGPSPLTDDGWLRTGDVVEADGDYVRFLGRRSEVITVGGEKVFPAEVESVLAGMEGLDDVRVRGESNALTGQAVVAEVKLATTESQPEFRTRMRAHCADRLARFKVPQRIVLVTGPLHGARFKKARVRPDISDGSLAQRLDFRSGISVVIPAYEEEAVIGDCLESLVAQDFEGMLQILVVANGCADGTAGAARAYARAMQARGFELEVIEVPGASKARALNAGDAVARHRSRLYLDADVELSSNALSSIANAFGGEDTVQFCSPRLVPVATTYAARVYARIWSQLPYVRNEVIGAGLYAVRGDGRSRWRTFPDIIADDKFARLHFAANERKVLDESAFLMYLPAGLGELIRVRSRWIRASRQLCRDFPELAASDKRRLAGVPIFVLRHVRLWGDVPVFAAIYACAELLALLPNRAMRWERASHARELRRHPS